MSQQQPKVSVIIPVYNTEPYLRECLESVINQTLLDIEIICVDDGSTDGSLAILREYQEKDSRVSVYTQPNLNAGAARNHGLRYAKGKYLSFLDSDDFFERNMLEDCYCALEATNADIVCFFAKMLDMRSGEISDMPWSLVTAHLPDRDVFSPEDISSKIFNSFQNWPWNKMFRHELIKKNNIRFQEIRRTNDMLFTCSALVSAERITVLKHPYAYYRIGTGNSLQQTNHLHPLTFWDAFTETKRYLISSGQYERYKQSFLNETLGGMLFNYHNMRDISAAAAVFFQIKYRGERDFSFTDYPENYYYDPNQIQDYLTIIKQDLFSSEAMRPYIERVERKFAEQEQRIAEQEQRIAEQERLIAERDKWLQDIKSSVSFRLGRGITWTPRKIRGGVRCYQEHGLRYTTRRLLDHIIRRT